WNSSSLAKRDQSAPFFSVQGERPPVSISQAEVASPSHMPRLKAGLKLLTRCSPLPPCDPRQRASNPAPPPVSAMCSPASAPLRIACFTPLFFVEVGVPPASAT